MRVHTIINQNRSQKFTIKMEGISVVPVLFIMLLFTALIDDRLPISGYQREFEMRAYLRQLLLFPQIHQLFFAGVKAV